jgi:hypothetical protein
MGSLLLRAGDYGEAVPTSSFDRPGMRLESEI